MKPRSFAPLVAVLALQGCAIYGLSSDPDEEPVDPNPLTPSPVLTALSASSIRVGEPLAFLGGRWQAEDGHTVIRLEGTYQTRSGLDRPVDLRIRPHVVSDTRLLWPNFGPFVVPFSPSGDELGTFHGIATAINVGASGGEIASRPIEVTLEVRPGLIVRALRPRASSCEAPARRLLGGFPYLIGVEAIGLVPAEFRYEVAGEPGAAEPTRVVHPATGVSDRFGDGGELVLAPVPDGAAFHATTLRLAVESAAGQLFTSEYVFGVHRPVEYLDWISPVLAEIERPVAVSGCIAGGVNGNHVEYTEQDEDTRSRTVSTSWDETWLQEHSSQYSTAHEQRDGVNLAIDADSESGWQITWNHTGPPSTAGSVGFLALAEAGARHSWPDGVHTVGNDFSVADTESVIHGDGRPIVEPGEDMWQTSSAITRSTSAEVLPSFYGRWFRQVTRVQWPGSVVAYNLCGQPQLVADAAIDDYDWAAHLGQGASCDEIEPALPAAECRLAPCAN